MFAAPGGLLFAVYFTPGGPDLFTSCSGQDVVAASGAFRGALETGVLSFSGNIGLEICWLEQAWATAVESVKTTGLVFMLGVGGLVFYKLYWTQLVNIGVGLRAFLFESLPLALELLTPIAAEDDEEDIDEIEDIEEEDVFDLFEIDLSVGLNCLSCEHRPKRKRGKGVYIADQIRTRWRHVTRDSRRYTSSSTPKSSTGLRRHYSSPEQLVRLGQLHKSAQDAKESSYMVHLSEESMMMDEGSSSQRSSSPNGSLRLRSHSLTYRDPSFQIGSVWSRWNGSVESSVSGMDVTEVSRLIRDCSIDSDGSDFSLDVSLNEGCGWSTLKVIERIEAEINSVKNNCLEMNQDIFTLNDNAEQDQEQDESALKGLHERIEFKGLLSLTAIHPDGMSDESLASNSPCHQRLNNEEDFSMEWDNQDLLTLVLTKTDAEAGTDDDVQPSPSASMAAMNMLEVQNNPIWCSQESGYLEWEGTPTDSSSSILTPLQEKRGRDSMSCTTSFSSYLTTPDDHPGCRASKAEEDLGSSSSCPSQTGKEKEKEKESEVRRRQWAEACHENRDSAIYDQGIDLDAANREESVGPAVQLRTFAQDTWQAPTSRAHAIKQAYVELEMMTGCSRMRGIRGDQYGILRASLCQMVLKRLAFPASQAAAQRILIDLERGSCWIREWSFGHRLPYGPENIVEGIHECFNTLDLVMGELTTERNALESLVSRLNADILLDTKLMEAIKLHVLSAALSLELADNLGDALPLFALALFSRPDSKNVKSLALNYLDPIGDSITLDRAEYYLLGYALGVRLDVYRPTALSLDKEETVDLLTSYPDWESFSEFLSIIEEDDRHFSIPVP